MAAARAICGIGVRSPFRQVGHALSCGDPRPDRACVLRVRSPVGEPDELSAARHQHSASGNPRSAGQPRNTAWRRRSARRSSRRRLVPPPASVPERARGSDSTEASRIGVAREEGRPRQRVVAAPVVPWSGSRQGQSSTEPTPQRGSGRRAQSRLRRQSAARPSRGCRPPTVWRRL